MVSYLIVKNIKQEELHFTVEYIKRGYFGCAENLPDFPAKTVTLLVLFLLASAMMVSIKARESYHGEVRLI